MSDEERSAYYARVEMGRKKLYKILRTDNVEELRTITGLVDDKYNPEGEGLLKKRLRSGKKLYPIEEAMKNNSVKCFDYIVSLNCLDLNEYNIFGRAVESNNQHFLNKLLTMDVDINRAVPCTYLKREYYNLDYLRRMMEHPNFDFDTCLDYLPPLEVYKFFFDECVVFNIPKFIAKELRQYKIDMEKINYLMSICDDFNVIFEIPKRSFYQEDNFTGTILAFVCCNSNHNHIEKLVQYMLDNGADPNISAEGGLNALEYQLTYRDYLFNKKVAKMLFDRGAEIDLEVVIPLVMKKCRHSAAEYLIDDLERDDILYLLDANEESSHMLCYIVDTFIEKFGVEILSYKDFAKNVKVDIIDHFFPYKLQSLKYLIDRYEMDCTNAVKTHINYDFTNYNDELKEFIKKNVTDPSILNHPKMT